MAGLSSISITAMVMMVLLMEVRITRAYLITGVTSGDLKLEVVHLRNCLDVQREGNTNSDVYTISPYDCCPERPVEVYCDMETDGGGWTVIQRRDDVEPREDFYLTWMEHALGFGNLRGEFWLGLDHIHALTDQEFNQIRFDLADFENNTRWAQYKFFYVHDRSLSYKMEVNGYTGDAGDAFSYHNGAFFSANDKDLDSHDTLECATTFKAGWWYNSCHNVNINGLYLAGPYTSYGDGVLWELWRGDNYSLKKIEMKIRPAY